MLEWYDIYKNNDEYNQSKKGNILMLFDDAISDMLNNKKLMQPIVTELFFSDIKRNISLIFITRFYFDVSKIVRLNSTHYVIMKFQTKQRFNKSQLIIHQTLTLKIL